MLGYSIMDNVSYFWTNGNLLYQYMSNASIIELIKSRYIYQTGSTSIWLEMYFEWKLEGLDERVNLVGAEIFISFIVASNSG